MRMCRTWDDNWNNVIRYEIFANEELKEMMCIPEEHLGDLRRFVTDYFVENAMSDVLVTKQDVMIVYYGEKGSEYGAPNVVRKLISFDIYVRQERLHDCDEDRLRQRTKVIAQMLREILIGRRYVQNMQFRYVDDYALGSKVVGYDRHHITFSYVVTH